MTESTASVLIRRSTHCDLPAIGRLAAANGQSLRGETFLLAEVRGELVAAAPLGVRGHIVGRSSDATADVGELLRKMADAIRRRDAEASLRRAA